MPKHKHYAPKKKEREYLRSQIKKRPEQFRAEIERTGGTPRQQARRKYLRRLMWNHRRDVMVQWYGPTGKDAPVRTRPMTDEERARYFPDGMW
jgi:hypothetical protein